MCNNRTDCVHRRPHQYRGKAERGCLSFISCCVVRAHLWSSTEMRAARRIIKMDQWAQIRTRTSCCEQPKTLVQISMLEKGDVDVCTSIYLMLMLIRERSFQSSHDVYTQNKYQNSGEVLSGTDLLESGDEEVNNNNKLHSHCIFLHMVKNTWNTLNKRENVFLWHEVLYKSPAKTKLVN